MSSVERDVRSLLAETRELLQAAEAGALDRVAELIEARSKTLDGLRRAPSADFSDAIRSIVDQVRSLDESVRRALEGARAAVQGALLEAREQRRALGALRDRGPGEPRFVSRRA